MSKPSHDSQILAFVTGAILGTLAYLLYLYLAQDVLSRTVFGWLFFPMQYPVIWIFGDKEFQPVIAILLMFAPVALGYGFLFWSFQRSLGMAVTILFVMTVGCWLWMHDCLPWQIFKLVFWPIDFLSNILGPLHFAPRGIRILIACLCTGFWYASVVCGGYRFVTLFRSSKKSTSSDSSFVNCPRCQKAFPTPITTTQIDLNCPNCHQIFPFVPKN